MCVQKNVICIQNLSKNMSKQKYYEFNKLWKHGKILGI